MQISVWAAFSGYTASDQEIKATELTAIEEDPAYWGDDCLQYDIDDPILQELLAQEDHGIFEEDYPSTTLMGMNFRAVQLIIRSSVTPVALLS